MRAQSFRAATRCETAKGPTCHCRCGGKLHGAKRFVTPGAKTLYEIFAGEEPDREFFEALAEDDPHHVRSAEEKRRRAKIKRAAAKAPNQATLWPLVEA